MEVRTEFGVVARLQSGDMWESGAVARLRSGGSWESGVVTRLGYGGSYGGWCSSYAAVWWFDSCEE
jgi:hypothetical protein